MAARSPGAGLMIGPTGAHDLPETVELDESPLGRCLATGRAVEGYEADGALGWVLALPLSAGSQQLGALLLVRQGQWPFGDEDRHLAEMVAGCTAMALQNARLAATDGLTGLYNRRYFEQTLAFECERARRLGRPLGLLMVDVDHFKQFNDEHGHLAGDAVLQVVGGMLGRLLRRTDIVARVGGEGVRRHSAGERLRGGPEGRRAGPPGGRGSHRPCSTGNRCRCPVSVGGATLAPVCSAPGPWSARPTERCGGPNGRAATSAWWWRSRVAMVSAAEPRCEPPDRPASDSRQSAPPRGRVWDDAVEGSGARRWGRTRPVVAVGLRRMPRGGSLPKYKVLLADDDPGLRKLVGTTLGTDDFALLQAGDGEETVRIARAEHPHIVLLDINTPRNGLLVCRELKADPATAGIKVVILTASGNPTDKQSAVDARADETSSNRSARWPC